jgi:hypothetical protein
MKNKSFWMWLSVLAIPVLILIGAQVDTSSGTSIGGGGYDLGPFVYSWLLIIVTVLWSLCALATAVYQRNRASSMRALGLTAIGLVTLAAVFLFYRENLF